MTRSKLNQFAATFAVAALALSGTAANAQTAYTLNGAGDTLLSFALASSATTTAIPLQGGVTLDAIDFRANGVLYGYSSANDTVYSVNTTTGVATVVGASVTGGAQETTTSSLGIDFNPTTGTPVGSAAAFRIVTANSENRVFNVATGAYTALAPGNPAGPNSLTFAAGGGAASVVENAYTNNLLGATTTTQFAIAGNNLYTLNNNGGVLTAAGTGLGLVVTPGSVGFDIYTTGSGVNSAFAIFQNAGNSNLSSLYSVDINSASLTYGAASLVGVVGGVGTDLRSLAVVPVVVPEAGTAQLVLGALALGAGVLVRRRK